ncbi:hypothetical protein [Streptomyces cellostaticus]|uniref:hypothetical protein n=1 Tax=Streptomyces cellostaticus TaxID=67285 RepID=UPI002025FFBC|nr:hypothetical protein [Streptomyces cellostaticus]
MTSPYSKASESGIVPPSDLLEAQVDVTLDDIVAAEDRLVRDGRWDGTWDDEPFYRKVTAQEEPCPGPTRGGRGAVPAVPEGARHCAAVLRLPLLCAEVAARLMNRIPAEWRSLA